MTDSTTSKTAKIPSHVPAEPDDMTQLAADIEATRRQFVTTQQMEAWRLMHSFESGKVDETTARYLFPVIQPLPEWLTMRLSPLFDRQMGSYYCSNAWLSQADAVQIAERLPALVSSDLGAQQMEDASLRHLSIFTSNYSRAWLRTNLFLLRREQAVMIRNARAQMQAGKTGVLGDVQSIVIPGSKWEISGDAATNKITLKLTPRPPWTTDTIVAGDHFFLLPLDGSKSWQLRPAQAATASISNF